MCTDVTRLSGEQKKKFKSVSISAQVIANLVSGRPSYGVDGQSRPINTRLHRIDSASLWYIDFSLERGVLTCYRHST